MPRNAVPFWIGAAALSAAVAIGAIWYFLLRDTAVPIVEESAVTAPAAPAAAPAPAPRPAPVAVPAPVPEPEVTLPPLNASDTETSDALAEAFGQQAVDQYLNPEDVIRKFVVTIDNLTRPTLPLDRRLVVATPELFVVGGTEDARVLSEENYARYAPLVAFVAATDARTIVAFYERYYPLMQEAYLELGNPDTVFSTRVVEVIDHLLATPEVSGPIDLVRPKVLYEYRDPAIETLSSGQKILIRIGPQHATTLKAKLREVRALLVQ